MRDKKAGGKTAVALGAILITVGLLAAFATAGCGAEGAAPAASSVSAPPGPSSTDAMVSETPSTGSEDLAKVFRDLAVEVQPMTVFAPTVLPKGSDLADEWWPVVELTSPEFYEGPAWENPRVLGPGPEAEIQVVFQTDEGWLVILENLQGDLGDVAGVPVGTVAGNPASLYDVNGGKLVQWSQDGLWYGVFGRDVSEADVIETALGMQPLLPGGP